jgi:hypothetical protein
VTEWVRFAESRALHAPGRSRDIAVPAAKFCWLCFACFFLLSILTGRAIICRLSGEAATKK